MLKEFDYVDSKGKVSHRVVFPITSPSNSYFTIDLTEFNEEEREIYEKALEEIRKEANKVWEEGIKTLGLRGNYRRFLEENIT